MQIVVGYSTFHFVNHSSVKGDGFLHDEGRVIFLPAPFGAHRVLMVTPAEDTLVRAGKRRGGLHTLIASNAVEAMLVAPALNQLVCRHTYIHWLSTFTGDITVNYHL